MLRFTRFLAFNLVMLIGVVALAEVALRLSDWRPLGAYTNLRYDNDPVAGPWLLPSQVGFFQTPCSLSAPVRVNGFGMRDRERSLAHTGQRLAVVGDSFTQGLHVGDEETVTRRLETMLGGRAEVLNFGVSSTGTSVQLLSYRARVRPFRPDVVLVIFYAGNDISDNLPALKRALDPVMGAISPYLLLDSMGRLVAEPQPGQPRRTSRLVTMASSSALGRWMYRGYQEFRLRLASAGALDGPGNESNDALFEEAWQLTEQVVARFAQEVRDDGARFGLVVIPDEDPEAGRVAVERLGRVAESAQFPVLDLTTRFGPSANSDALEPTYFTCDGHWSARGHAVAAEAILTFLDRHGWIEPS